MKKDHKKGLFDPGHDDADSSSAPGLSQLHDFYFRTASDIFCYIDRHLKVRQISPSVERLLGYSPEELIGREFPSLGIATKSSVTRAVADAADVLKGKSLVGREFELITKAGDHAFFEVTAMPFVRDNRTEGFVFVARNIDTRVRPLKRDIEDNKKIAEQLRESEERLKILFESAPDAYYLNDVKGTFVDGNVMAEKLIGYKRKELIGKNFLRLGLLQASQLPRAAASLARNALGKSSGPEEFTLKRRDGTWLNIEVSTHPVQIGGRRLILGIARDITARRKAEEDLRKEAAFRKATVERAAEGIAVCSPVPEQPGLRFNVWNSRMTQITGYTMKEINKSGWFESLYPDPAQRERARTRGARLLEGEDILGEELEIVRKDGKPRTVLISSSIISSGDEEVSILGMVHDLTDRKKSEEELRRAHDSLAVALSKLKETQQQVVQNERLKALGQMASGIAHDFNNALMPIMGYTDVILSEPEILDDRDEIMAMISSVHSAARDAASTVRRLREFYRPHHKDNVVSTDLNEIVRTTVTYTRPHWKEEKRAAGVFIETSTDLGEIPAISATEPLLREMLVNLILNAADAIKGSGAISIITSSTDSEVLLRVTDSGIGMTEEVQQQCFEPFFTTKGPEGSGMGLAMAYGIVQRHNGRIQIDSAPDEGTTVSVWFPLKALPKAEENVPKPEIVEPQSSLRVLCIDDEDDAREIEYRYLKSLGHRVAAVEDGASGVAAFKKDTFDLVIVDRAMPDMSGDQVAVVVKELSPGTPVLMLTGFGSIMEDTDECPEGVDQVLGKPVTRTELRQAISQLMA